MVFTQQLKVDTNAVLQALGYRTAKPDAQTEQKLKRTVAMLEETCAPRWVYRQYALQTGGDAVTLPAASLVLEGRDIKAHLSGCHACFLLAVTLGASTDGLLRAAEADDMATAVLLDVAASTLVEQYADLAQEALMAEASSNRVYTTGRFSPGYGDLPIGLQSGLLAAVDAGRAIGLTANSNSILIPRKSITAIVGIANKPVTGKLAGCGNCALRGKCSFAKGGAALCQNK